MLNEIIVLLVSTASIAIGAILWQKGNHLTATGKKAKAVIFKNNYSGTSPSGGMYYPVVRFLTEKQQWITQELSIGYNPPKEEGTKLEVIYDPDDPTHVEINSPFQLEILPRLFVAIGICGFVFGVLEMLDIVQLMGE